MKRSENLNLDGGIFENLVNHSSHEIAVADLGGKILYTNQAWAKNHGYLQKDLIGKKLTIFHPKNEIKQVNEFNKNLLKHGVWEGEIIHLRKDGSTYITLMKNYILKADKKRYLVAMASDFTKKKNLEEAKNKQQILLNAIANSVQDSIFAKDLDRRYTFVNPTMCKLVGKKRDEIIGKKPSEIYIKDVVKEIRIVDDISFRGKIINKTVNLRLNNKDYILQVIQGPLKDEKGKVFGVTGVVRDITEATRSGAQLTTAKEEVKTILEAAPIIIVLLDGEGKIKMINNEGAKVLGYNSSKNLKGKLWFNCCLPKNVVPEVTKVFKKIMKGQEKVLRHYQNPIITKNGEEKIISWYNNVTKDEKGKINGIISSGIDITDVIETEKELRRTAEDLARINTLMIGREKRMAELKKKIKNNE